MQFYLNEWGGEGFLTASSVLTMTLIGMFDGITNSKGSAELIYNYFDFTGGSDDEELCKTLRSAHTAYFETVFGHKDKTVQYGGIEMEPTVTSTAPPTLAGRFASGQGAVQEKMQLSVGVSEADSKTNIRKGVYGKPWVGEAYHSDARFNTIYTAAEGDIVIINCGGYKGGGTAATFIPLETARSAKELNPNIKSIKRFSLIVGPSTEFKHTVEVEHPEIYYGSPSLEFDLFDIKDKGLSELRAAEHSPDNDAQHEENISALNKAYEDVLNADHDYRSLNPKHYMKRFADRVRSDSTLKDAVNFIYLKPGLTTDGNGLCRYDRTCDEFLPDNQNHRIHITNLLNAITVQEILMHFDKKEYESASVFTFATDSDKLTAENLFLPEDTRKFYRFLAFSVMIVRYLYSFIVKFSMPGAEVLNSKWALRTGLFQKVIAADTKTLQGQVNAAFSNAVKEELEQFVNAYIEPVLRVLIDVHETNDDVELFPEQAFGNLFEKGVCGIVKELYALIQPDKEDPNKALELPLFTSGTQALDVTNKMLAAILTGHGSYDGDFDKTLSTITDPSREGGSNFLGVEFQAGFPSIDLSGMIQRRDIDTDGTKEKARAYSRQIIGYTYRSIAKHLI